jgi:hypothetical protein
MIRLFAIVVLAGCSSGTTQQVSYEVRLRGVNTAGASAVFLDVKDLKISAGDHAIATQPGQRKIDLARVNHAWLLGTFVAPPETTKLHVDVVLDDFGAFEASDGAGFIDAQGGVLQFDAPIAWLSQRGQATLELDVARSLVKRGAEERRLVPQVRVLY